MRGLPGLSVRGPVITAQMLTIHQITRLLGPGARPGRAHSCVKALSLGPPACNGGAGGGAGPRGGPVPCGADFPGQAVCTHAGHSKTVGRSNFPDLPPAFGNGKEGPSPLRSSLAAAGALVHSLAPGSSQRPLPGAWGTLQGGSAVTRCAPSPRRRGDAGL